MSAPQVTGEDLDKATDLVWEDIFELVTAIQTGASDSEIADAKERISWSLIEFGNISHLRGQQSVENKEQN